MENTLREYNFPRKLLRIATTMGVWFNGTAVAAVLTNPSRSFMNLHIRYVHWIAARLPNCEIRGILSPTLATPTIRSIKCKQSPVDGVFDRYFHIRLPIITKHKLGLPFPPKNLPIKFGTYPSTIFLVIVVTDTDTHTQTDRQTNQRR